MKKTAGVNTMTTHTPHQRFKSNFQNEPYVLNVSKHFGKEYIPMFEDAIRLFVVQCIIQFMYFIKEPREYALLDVAFFELILYTLLGVCVYWLLIKRLLIVT